MNLEIGRLEISESEESLTSAWTKLVQSNSCSGFMQSLPWCEFKNKQKLGSVHFVIYEGQKLIAGAIFYYALGESSSGGFLVAPHGPVLPWQDPEKAEACLKLIIASAHKFADQTGLIGMRIEPLIESTTHSSLPEFLLEFGRAPVDLVPRETLFIDLAAEEEQILAAMKAKGRYNIRLAQRKNVTVRQGTPGEMLEYFYPILTTTGRRDNFEIESATFFAELADTLMTSKMAELLLAEHENDVVGGLILIKNGSTATYLYGGITNEKRQLMTGYALQWEAMKRARAAGCLLYDMYGYYQFRSPGHAYGLFSNFKSQFGGAPKRFIGAHDYYFVDQLADRMIKAFALFK